MRFATNATCGPIGGNVEARYRAESAKPGPVLRRKKCACGATVTAKQLQIYGACEKCAKSKAATSDELATASDQFTK